ncbi:MAG: hypothetical protein Q9200_007579 [Gallowayella weberi]
MDGQKTYVVEHLDPECGPWSILEYTAIANESIDAEATFCLSSAPEDLELPGSLTGIKGFNLEHRSVEDVYQNQKDRVCLLDPAAKEELSPIDIHSFDIFVFGGILGDDPPRDRTSELRKKGFAGRRLGPIQMTTDTAVRVTRMVIQGQTALNDIPYIDHPEIRIDEHESTEMPFRYVKDAHGKPVMPEPSYRLSRLPTGGARKMVVAGLHYEHLVTAEPKIALSKEQPCCMPYQVWFMRSRCPSLRHLALFWQARTVAYIDNDD